MKADKRRATFGPAYHQRIVHTRVTVDPAQYQRLREDARAARLSPRVYLERALHSYLSQKVRG